VADAAGEGEYQFEGRGFGASPEQLGQLAESLIAGVQEAVMESTGPYWAGGGLSAPGAGAIRSRAAGAQERF
jgi:hypothetical protein